MWDIDDDSRDEILSRCMRLNELYQAEYFEVKKSMEEVNNFNFFFSSFFLVKIVFVCFFANLFLYLCLVLYFVSTGGWIRFYVWWFFDINSNI